MPERRKPLAKHTAKSFIITPTPSDASKLEIVSGLFAVAAILFTLLHHRVLVSSYQEFATEVNAAIYKWLTIGCVFPVALFYIWNLDNGKNAWRHRNNFISLCLIVLMILAFILLQAFTDPVR